MKKFSLLLIAFSIFLFTKESEAKLLPQAGKITSKQTISKISGTGISISPRLRVDRRALIVYFSNLQNAKAVSYVLTYNTSVQQEGAMGSLNLSGGSNQTQELLFGTCSKGVGRYNTGINNAGLEVTYTPNQVKNT